MAQVEGAPVGCSRGVAVLVSILVSLAQVEVVAIRTCGLLWKICCVGQ
jgi:hypothetical protein